MRARAARLCVALGLVASVLLQAAPVSAPAAAGTEAIPDLAVAPLEDFRVETAGNQRLLRFSATMVNVGAGHFELRGSRGNTSEPMSMRQVIYQTAAHDSPISREIATSAVAHYSGDGHDHWHVQDMTRYDLWGHGGIARGAKVGFCFLDTDPYDVSLPGASSSPFYHGCSNDPNALSNMMGISIGWGDLYHWSFAHQWIDITGLPSGTYTVRARVDPHGFFLEANEVDQCAFATISISADANDVGIIQSGTTCVNDWIDSEFAGDIAWAFSSGVTAGCAPEMFCPLFGVTREQMASFLARTRGLGATGTDFFTDDEATFHEDDINRIAAAGITVGCAAGLFCPYDSLNREQMASFLVRAFSLQATPSDFFTDDEGSIHEEDINAVAASGITFGCGGPSFCPLGTVTRGQMAAFLHRAVTD